MLEPHEREPHGYQDLRSHHVGAKNMLESAMATRI